LELDVQLDCQYILWEPPTSPASPFYVNQATIFLPDRDTQGDSWVDECGYAELSFSGPGVEAIIVDGVEVSGAIRGLQDWMIAE
jgi:hypothetical protein